MNDRHDRRRMMHPRLLYAATPILAAVVASGAVAQDYEYEPDEGVHEEEWYDPSDWFDDDMTDDAVTVDYEYDWNAYAAYWDGYYDGYDDDVYGYDYWDDAWSPEYASLYTDGYYDGYYDSTRDYDFDPAYYIYTWVDPYEDSADARRRSKDDSRTRGDRADENSSASKNEKADASKKSRAMTRLRGTLAGMKVIDASQRDGHLVLRLSFDDGTSKIVDLGPKMTKSDLPFAADDRVTLAGRMRERGDRSVLVVHTITADGDTMRIRGERSAKRKDDPRGRDRSRSDRRNAGG